jgi:putative phosphoribosyl transferase
MPPFRDRSEAGAQLADAVRNLFESRDDRSRPVVLALPRGGVPVAYEVARALGAPLDLVLVRKIGVPSQPELAAAAIVDGACPEMVVNEDVVRGTRMSEEDLDAGRTRALAEIERRRALYFGERAPVTVAGRDVVVVDDGIATGATARVALHALRSRGARSLTLAVPVAAPDALPTMIREADHVIALRQPAAFGGVGSHYLEFHQLDDSEVIRLLEAARAFAPSEA